MSQATFRVGASAESANGLPATINESLDILEKIGTDTVELPLLWMELVANGEVMPARLEELRQALAGRPFGYSAHAAIGINFMSDPVYLDLHVRLARAHLAISAELGCEHMVLHTGFCPPYFAKPQIEKLYDQQRETFLKLGEEAKAAGVVLCVENIFAEKGNRLTATPSQLAKELRLINHSHVMACLDVSHAALHCDSLGLDLMEEAGALVPLAKHVHIHDSFGRTGNIPVHTQQEALGLGVGDLHLPIGWGNLPFDEIVCLDRFPKDAIFNIELNKHRWHAIEETVVAARRVAKLAFEHSRPD
jgi:sugar phosphate isomerase/epimerase